MDKKNKIAAAGMAATGAAGVTAAVAGETILWVAFCAGPGAVLAGAAETSAFLAWVGGGSLAAGGGGMAAGSAVLAAIGPVGWTVAGIGAVGAGIAIIRRRRKNKKMKKPH